MQGEAERARRGRTWPATAVLAVVVAVLGVLPACQPVAGGCTVGVVGDSLTVGIQPWFAGDIAARGCTLTFLSGQKSRSTAAGVQVIDNIARLGFLPDVLIVALGTNDDGAGLPFLQQVEHVMAVAAGRKVIWVNIDRPATEGRLNWVLSVEDSRYDNLSVYDWNSFIDAHPQLHAGDGIHLNPGGYRLRSALMAQQVSVPPPPVTETTSTLAPEG